MNFKMKAKPTPKIKSAAICGNVWDKNPDFFSSSVNSKNITRSLNSLKVVHRYTFGKY